MENYIRLEIGYLYRVLVSNLYDLLVLFSTFPFPSVSFQQWFFNLHHLPTLYSTIQHSPSSHPSDKLIPYAIKKNVTITCGYQASYPNQIILWVSLSLWYFPLVFLAKVFVVVFLFFRYALIVLTDIHSSTHCHLLHIPPALYTTTLLFH